MGAAIAGLLFDGPTLLRGTVSRTTRICTALEAVIDCRPDLVLAAIAHTSTQAIALAGQHRPDLAIVDGAQV